MVFLCKIDKERRGNLFVVGACKTIKNITMETSDVKELFTYNHTVRQNYVDAFKKLSSEYMNKNKIRRNNTVKDVLIHVMAEELHHRGEIIAILWQMNIQPPDMGWLSVMKKTDPLWVLK